METRESIREKIAQTRRLLAGASDDKTLQSLRTYIEEMEQRLVQLMAQKAG